MKMMPGMISKTTMNTGMIIDFGAVCSFIFIGECGKIAIGHRVKRGGVPSVPKGFCKAKPSIAKVLGNVEGA